MLIAAGLTLLGGTASVLGFAGPALAGSPTLCGDANCDGQVDFSDSIAILQALANSDKYELSETGRANADVAPAPSPIRSPLPARRSSPRRTVRRASSG